ncbi:MAG: MBL fold metallo-hydrolase [Ignavibacteriae bacterium]|nr:MBL fold metallo-hydrolase [Ignavibacteriota bacterium]
MSIFGPGYGEAIALHVECGKWILVDSCLEPTSGQPAQVQYLEQLGLDVSTAVKLVVATHWHDDHVQGIGTLVARCRSADVVMSAALKSEHFSALLRLYGEGAFPGSSGVTEFVNVLRLLDERRQAGTKINMAKLAVPDKLLYRDSILDHDQSYDVEIHSLSPSDASIVSAQLDFSQRIPLSGERKKRIVPPHTNATSVVLWVEIGERRLLLGSDLEKTADPKTGWTVILNDSQVTREKAFVYKVAHHGSESSHDPGVWERLLHEQPYALLSPYMIGGNILPKDGDIDRLARLTPNAYMTATPGGRRFRMSNRVVRDTVESVAKEIRGIRAGWGQVRLRCGIQNDALCHVELFGDAHNIAAS